MGKITIDKEKCIGCGSCVAIAEEFFQLKGEKAAVKRQPKTKEEEAKVKEAIESCPVEAIIMK